MMLTIVYGALTIVMAHLAFGVALWFRVRKLYSYPNALGFPVIGNLYYFYRTLFILTMDGVHRYGIPFCEELGNNGIFFHWLLGDNILAVITSPEIVKKLSFHPNLADKPSMYKGFQNLFNGPFSRIRSDDEWKQKRKEYNINLKKSRVDNDYCNDFIKCADKMVNNMLASPCDVDTHVVSISLAQDVSLRTLYGVETSLIYHPEVIRVLNKMSKVANLITLNATIMATLTYLLQPFLAEVRKLMLEETCNKLKSNQSPLQGKELPLSTFMASRNRKNNESETLLLNELHELFISSGHTVSTTFANTLYFLAVLPDIQERAWQEQNEIFGKDIRDPTLYDLNRMQFLDRFIKESLRFIGPPFVGKIASADIKIDEITIPRNTVIFYMLHYIRFDPKNWKNPHVFDPDRFLDHDDSLKYIYSPFGVGVRSCPGVYFGTTLMKIALSKMLRRLKLTLVDKNFRFEDIKYKFYMLREIENPPKVQVKERM